MLVKTYCMLEIYFENIYIIKTVMMLYCTYLHSQLENTNLQYCNAYCMFVFLTTKVWLFKLKKKIQKIRLLNIK